MCKAGRAVAGKEDCLEGVGIQGGESKTPNKQTSNYRASGVPLRDLGIESS
jgi:hypothetical protein